MNIIRVRSFNLTGTGQSTSYALSSFAKQIADIEKGLAKNTISVGNLNVRRDYTDVRDGVKAYYQLALKAKPGTVYNICSGIAHSLKDLLDILVSMSTVKINIEVDKQKFRPSDLPIMLGDNTKIRTEIGWEPEIEIQNTLSDLLDHWRTHNT